MTIAKVQMPDGRIAKFDVPEGTTPEQVVAFAQQMSAPAPQEDQSFLDKAADFTSPIRAGVQGVQQGVERFGAGVAQNVGAPLASAAGQLMGGQIPSFDKTAEDIDTATGVLNEKMVPSEQQQALAQEHPNITGVGEFVGEVAPSFAFPVAKTIKGTAATGGALSGLMFNEEADKEEKIEDIGVGTVLSAAADATIRGAGPIVRKIANMRSNTGTPPSAAEIVKLGEAFDIPVHTQNVSPNQFVRFAADASSEVPLVGTGKGLAAQADARIKAVEKFGGNLSDGLDEPLDIAQKSLKARFNKVKTQSGKNWSKVAQQSGDEIIDPVSFSSVIDDAIKTEANHPMPDEGLQKLLADWKGSTSTIVNDMVTGTSRKPTSDFATLSMLRSSIGDEISGYYTGANAAIGKRGVQHLQRAKEALEADMEAYAKKKGGNVWDNYNRAKTYDHKIRFAAFKDTPLKNMIDNFEVEKIQTWLEGGASRQLREQSSKARLLHRNLDNEGRAAMRTALYNSAMKKATNASGELNPNQFASLMQKNTPLTNVFFKGTDKVELDGLVKLLHATASKDQATNLLARRVLLVGSGLGAGLGGAPAMAGLAISTKATQLLTQTPTGRKLLITHSKLTPGSAAAQRSLEKLAHYVSVASAAGSAAGE